jgi:osmotically-inducible protein OsmY
MTKYATLALLVAGCLLAGCSEKTSRAVQEDTQDTVEAVLTPKIKSAIIANPILNEDGNVIDVETEDGVVYLRGHVMTQEAKDEASQIAQRVLDESESDYRLLNELEIQPKASDDDDDDKDNSGSGY